MQTKHCGPITLNIDPQAEHITFTVTRSGPTSTQLGSGSMANVASWALTVAESYPGYSIDTTPIMPFFNCNDCEKSEGSEKSKRRNSG